MAQFAVFSYERELPGGVSDLPRNLDHATELAKFVPIMNGGVEVRPLLGD